MMACGQIVNFGWREGLSPEEAKAYFEEAKKVAVASNDLRAHALILAGYGRILAASGSADQYVEKLREAETLIGESIDASLRVTLRAVLCHALRLSGRMIDALAVNTDALQHVGEVKKFDRQMLGFDIEPWLIAMRGQTLVMLGRFDEARTYLDRVISMDAAHVDIMHHVIPSLAYVDLAWATGDAQLAARHAERAFSMAMKSSTPYPYLQSTRRLAAVSRTLSPDRLDEGLKDLRRCSWICAPSEGWTEAEPRILADLANAYRLEGQFASAVSTATEAITIATARHARVAQCFVHIVRAEALFASPSVGENIEVVQELNQAEELVKETGVVIFAPLIQIARAKLVGTAKRFGSSANTRFAGSG